MQTRGRRRSGAGNGRIDRSTPRGSRSVRSPSPRRRAPQVNEDRLQMLSNETIAAAEHDHVSVTQILSEQVERMRDSFLAHEEVHHFLGTFSRSVESTLRFMESLETRGQPVIALVAMGFAFASSIGLLASFVVFYASILTLEATFRTWTKTKTLLISSMLCILIFAGYALEFSTQFYMGTCCGIFVACGLMGVFYF